MAKKKTDVFLGTGRRKSSVARVFLKPGKGNIVVNNQDVNEYMPYQTLVMDLKQPLTILDVAEKYDVVCNVHGGGFTGQAGAIRLGIARALLEAGHDRGALKKAGMLTQIGRASCRERV